MPQARRRTAPAKDTPATEPEANEATNGEATEGEDTPKRAPRAAKVYKVVDAELANELAGDGEEINEGDPATGEMIDRMRSNKAKWDSPEDGGIKHVFGSNSAIPLRNMYNKYLAEQDDEDEITLDDVDALYEALVNEGQGWVTLAARTGATASEVRAALKDKVMEEHDVDITEGGHAYGKGDNWTWVTAEQLNEAKAANGNGSDDEEEGDEEGEDEAEATSDEPEAGQEEAPAPRRRRRASA